MAKRESSAANEQAEDCESAAAGSSKENNPSDAQKKDAEHAECAPPEKRRKTIESKEAADTIKSNNGVSQDNKTECQDSGSGASGSAIAAVKEEITVKEENSDDSSSSWDELANEIVDESAPNDVKSEPKEELPDDEPLPDLKRITSFKTLGPHIAKQKNHLNYLYMADVPQICKDEPCMLGIDEAGRGPVLGPMVYGIAFCPLSKAENLKTLGCADSKQLTEPVREQIFDDLLRKEYASSTVGWAIDVISPNYISNKMLSRVKISLNEISMCSAIGLINKAIDAGVNIAEVYVDTVGPPDKYQARLAALFPDFQITVAKKADSTYPIVSAASICAKVARDQSLKFWIFPEGLTATYKDFGSGYPNDPKTKAFLENNVDKVFGFPRLVRFSWATAINVLERKAYRMDFAGVDDQRDMKYKAAAGSIKKFLKPKAKKVGGDHNNGAEEEEEEDDLSWYVPCRLFRDCYLEHCEDI